MVKYWKSTDSKAIQNRANNTVWIMTESRINFSSKVTFIEGFKTYEFNSIFHGTTSFVSYIAVFVPQSPSSPRSTNTL